MRRRTLTPTVEMEQRKSPSIASTSSTTSSGDAHKNATTENGVATVNGGSVGGSPQKQVQRRRGGGKRARGRNGWADTNKRQQAAKKAKRARQESAQRAAASESEEETDAGDDASGEGDKSATETPPISPQHRHANGGQMKSPQPPLLNGRDASPSKTAKTPTKPGVIRRVASSHEPPQLDSPNKENADSAIVPDSTGADSPPGSVDEILIKKHAILRRQQHRTDNSGCLRTDWIFVPKSDENGQKPKWLTSMEQKESKRAEKRLRAAAQAAEKAAQNIKQEAVSVRVCVAITCVQMDMTPLLPAPMLTVTNQMRAPLPVAAVTPQRPQLVSPQQQAQQQQQQQMQQAQQQQLYLQQMLQVPGVAAAAFSAQMQMLTPQQQHQLLQQQAQAAMAGDLPAMQRLRFFADQAQPQMQQQAAAAMNFTQAALLDPLLQQRILTGAFGEQEKRRLEQEIGERHKEQIRRDMEQQRQRQAQALQAQQQQAAQQKAAALQQQQQQQAAAQHKAQQQQHALFNQMLQQVQQQQQKSMAPTPTPSATPSLVARPTPMPPTPTPTPQFNNAFNAASTSSQHAAAVAAIEQQRQIELQQRHQLAMLSGPQLEITENQLRQGTHLNASFVSTYAICSNQFSLVGLATTATVGTVVGTGDGHQTRA
jgi:hypothetical protein